MAEAPSIASDRGFRPMAWALGLLGAAFGLGVGYGIGQWWGYGYRFDWYRHENAGAYDAFHVALASAVAGVAAAALLVPLALSIAHRTWRHRLATQRAPPQRPSARPRSVHSLRVGLALVVGLPALVLLVTLFLLVANGLQHDLTAHDLRFVTTAAGGLVGLLAPAIALRRTGKALAAGRIGFATQDENFFARIALFSGRRAGITILLLLVLTAILGAGMTRIDTNVDVADVLPRGDPNTDAAHHLTEKFKSSFTLQVTFQIHVASAPVYNRDAKAHLPNRQTSANLNNISDEVYVRALDQLIEYVKNYVDPETGEHSPFVSSVTLPELYRLINWTLAGGRGAPLSSYSLPPPDSAANEAQYLAVDRGVWAAIPDAADALISPDFKQTAALVTVDPNSELLGKEIGEWALRIRDAYVEWAETHPEAYKVFTGDNPPLFSVDLPLANAHSSHLAAHDFKKLLPVLCVWIIVTVFIAFRSVASIGIALAALAIDVVWTFGLMGYMRIPLNTLNLTVIPLIMGVGIDYGIHTLNEYQEGRASGLSREDTFRRLGARGFLSLFVATLNTVVGLGVMMASPSLLIAQLGVLANIAIISSFLITITFMPAGLSLLPSARARTYRPSPLMGGLATLVSRHRLVVLLVLLLVSASALLGAQRVGTEAFGDPPRNWLPKDSLRREHELAIERFYNSPVDDVKANILIFEGDMTDPTVHRYMDAIEASLRTYGVGSKNLRVPSPDFLKKNDCELGSEGRLITDTLRTLPFFVRTYLTVRGGGPGAVQYLAGQQLRPLNPAFDSTDPYPTTQKDLSALLDEVLTTPLKGLGSLFYDGQAKDMGMMLFSVKAASYQDAREVWCQVHAAVALVDLEGGAYPPPQLRVSFFGNTAINYLFVAKELPWVLYMSVVDNVLVMAFVYLPTRLLRPTLTVGALNLLTGAWWYATLPFFGVGNAITLTLPIVFIQAIGSDYGLHLALSALETNDTRQSFRTTGKAILFSGITTFGAFLIFTQMSNLAVRRTMIATSVAIPIIFLVTILVVPLMYPVGRRFREHASSFVHAAVTAPTAPHAPLPSTATRMAPAVGEERIDSGAGRVPGGDENPI